METAAARRRSTMAKTVMWAGALLLAWSLALIVVVEFSSLLAFYGILGALLIIGGRLYASRDRLGVALEDIAESIDPLVTPPHLDVPEGADEAHAPGKRHVPRDQ